MKHVLLVWALLIGFLLPASAQPRKYKFHPSTSKSDYLPHTLVVKFRPEAAVSNRRPDAEFNPAISPRMKQLGISRSAPVANAGKTRLRPAAGKSGAARYTAFSLIHRVEISPAIDLEAAINLLLNDPLVEYAEPLYRRMNPLGGLPRHLPGDPYAALPADNNPYAGSPLEGKQYYLQNIRAYEAWEIEKGNPEVTIGIIDFGTQVNHEDLRDNIRYNLAEIPGNGIDDDGNGYIDDYAGWNSVKNNGQLQEDTHGTRVAGCAAGTPGNGKGIAGVGYHSTFIPVTAYQASPQEFNPWDAIMYAVERGCKIINLSYETGLAPFQWEQDLFNSLVNDFDVVVVAAAGNTPLDIPFYPASYDNVISVAGTDAHDVKYPGSTYSPKVDISAPGYLVQTTIDNYLIASGYGADNGTSYAAPLVAGAAALVRSRFPELSATEIRERLLRTADYIDTLAGNRPYAGKLGSGRLNVYRALTESLVISHKTFRSYRNSPYLRSGQEASLTVSGKNYGPALTGVTAELSTQSPYVTVTEGVWPAGTISSAGTVENSAAPFRLYISREAPAHTPVTFQLSFRDAGNQIISQCTFTERINPDYLDIDINQVKLTATAAGRIGFNDYFTAEGLGLTYKNQQLLYEAGLMLGVSASQVSNSVRASVLYPQGGYPPKDQHFTATQPIRYSMTGAADLAASSVFTDTVNNSGKIGLQVAQHTYAWKEAPHDKYVIVEYQITNHSGADIPSLFAALFADWDLPDQRYVNKAGWDAANNLGYVHNSDQSIYSGIQLLTTQSPAYYVFDEVWGSGIYTYDGFSGAEKFQSMSGGIARPVSGAGDTYAAQVIGAGLTDLKSGETRTVAFAFLAGDNLTELRASAAAAQQQFRQLPRNSPLPEIAASEFCAGSPLSITPGNGTRFNFYDRLPLTVPLATGSSFSTGILTGDSTFYVTNVDSLYESAPLALRAKAISHASSFVAASPTVEEKSGLQLTDQSDGAVKWHWSFGDGMTSTEQHPQHSYQTPGEYIIRLRTENNLGCTSETTRTIQVTRGPQSPLPLIASRMLVCQNASVILAPANGETFRLYTQAASGTPVRTGASFEVGPISRDTVFYLTSIDQMYESERASVEIRVSTVSARFSLLADTIDLQAEQVLQVVDASTNAEKWFWDFGDGNVSTGPDPSHSYTHPGEYLVQLIAENADNCRDSTAQRVVVTRTLGLEADLASIIRVHPNPTDGKFRVQLSGQVPRNSLTIRISNAIGQQISDWQTLHPDDVLDLSAVRQGVYYLTIRCGKQTVIKRVVRL